MSSLRDGRRPYIDRARGVAVLVMILAHVLDSWTRRADRSGAAFRDLTILGGLAAPMFLWLAGLALALAGERAAARTGSRKAGVEAIARRGLEIFILAFLFRLQAFVVSPGGPLVAIFRVDILNVMGPAIVCAGLLWGASRGPRRAVVVCGAAAAAVALTGPLVRSAVWVEQLPIWLQWYLRPSGDLTTFTLFPWSGFVLAGAAAGSLLSIAGDQRLERRVIGGLTLAGAVLVAVGFVTASRPAIYANTSFWTSSPTYFAIRLGIVTLTLSLVYAITALTRKTRPWEAGLEQFGRRSLFIYWIHVELVYGYFTWPVHGRLPVWGSLASYVLFCGVMYGAMQLRDRAVLRLAVPAKQPDLDKRVLHA